jgi:outer membrane protein assembly factor BamB
VRLAVTLALAGLAAGCGSTEEQSAPAKHGPEGKEVAPAPKPKLKRTPRSTRARLVITVVNGDTNRRVRGALVHVARKRDGTDAKGVAEIVVRRRAPLNVTVRARGYNARTVRMPFQRRRKVTVRIYRKALQWPLFGVDSSRSQAHSEISVRPPFRVVWSRGIGSLIEFPAVVSDGVAYIGNYRGTIYAISMRFGKTVWKYDPPGGKMASSPAVVGDELVVHGMDGFVRVLDRRNGRLLRQIVIGSPIESSPVVRNGVDYFGAWNGSVYALDLRTGRLRWTYAAGYKITSSAALSGGTLFIGDYGGRILALSAASGRLRWARSVNGRVYGTPAVADGRVFVPSSTGGSLTTFSTSGRHLWSVHTGSYVYSSPAVWGGRVYFGSYNGLLYAVSARTGARLWTVGAGGPVSGAAVVVGGVAYAGSTYGSIVGADARTGRTLLRFPHGEYVPVSGSGRRLLLHGYSRLYAVDAARK